MVSRNRKLRVLVDANVLFSGVVWPRWPIDYLVSLDRDLTDPGEPVHQYLRVLLPAVFLRDHMGWSSEQLERIRFRNWDEFVDG